MHCTADAEFNSLRSPFLHGPCDHFARYQVEQLLIPRAEPEEVSHMLSLVRPQSLHVAGTQMKTSSHSQDTVRLQARERRVSKTTMSPIYIRMQTKALMQ